MAIADAVNCAEPSRQTIHSSTYLLRVAGRGLSSRELRSLRLNQAFNACDLCAFLTHLVSQGRIVSVFRGLGRSS
jgi:tRNA(Arg) A34 adenosine deaminase TadA